MTTNISPRATDVDEPISLVRRRRPRHVDNVFEMFFGRALDEHLAAKHAMNLAAGELWMNASLKGISFVTTRNRAHKVAHVAMRTCTIWRRALAGPQLERIVAQGVCGQWVMRAAPADWSSNEARCERCIAELGRILKQTNERGVASA